MSLDLQSLLAEVKPNLITPHLAELTAVKNDKKPKTLAHLLVKHYHANLTKPVAKQIVHKGRVHTVRYFDIEPLLRGVWAEMSLILLNVSFAEQCDIIDALYPEDVQFAAKCFAIHFTKDTNAQAVIPVQDEDVTTRLDATNVGIAMILATLSSMGGNLSGHPDMLQQFIQNMHTVAKEAKTSKKNKAQYDRLNQTNTYRDRQK